MPHTSDPACVKASVDRFRAILENYLKVTGEDSSVLQDSPEQPVADLIADLRHFCDAWDLDYLDCEDRGSGHYNSERTWSSNQR
jgi:hypothetical protein